MPYIIMERIDFEIDLKKGAREIAMRMLSKGFNEDMIAELTNLSIIEIQSLRKALVE